MKNYFISIQSFEIFFPKLLKRLYPLPTGYIYICMYILDQHRQRSRTSRLSVCPCVRLLQRN